VCAAPLWHDAYLAAPKKKLERADPALSVGSQALTEGLGLGASGAFSSPKTRG
jgi:hypothetical protein